MDDELSKDLEKIAEVVAQFVNELYEALCKIAETLCDKDFIDKIIEQVKQLTQGNKPKYDKNIRNFKKLNNHYTEPCYKIRPKARSRC
jgi:hypothetical protein